MNQEFSISPASGPASAGFARPAKPERRSLGKDAKTVGQSAKNDARLGQWAAKRKAAKLLREAAPKMAKRISDCGYVNHAHDVTLSAVTHANGEVSSMWSGLVTCSNVWACPVCSSRIADERRAELNALLSWSRSEGHSAVMLTLTHRHKRRDPLAGNLDGMKKALKRFRQAKTWRALPLVGNVGATEVTHGRNGWHVHFHLLLICKGGEASALEAVSRVRPQWLGALSSEGLQGNEHAFQVQGASSVGEYLAKFGAAEELALSGKKTGRGGSRTPWQLLSDARDGDAQAGALFVEYALAFKGRRQLVWSRGLKALAGVEAAVKAQAEAEAAQRSEPVPVRSWPGGSEHWRQARRRRCALSAAVEAGRCVDRAEFGPTDAERWREALAGSQVIDDDPGEVPFRASRGAPAAMQAGAV